MDGITDRMMRLFELAVHAGSIATRQDEAKKSFLARLQKDAKLGGGSPEAAAFKHVGNSSSLLLRDSF